MATNSSGSRRSSGKQCAIYGCFNRSYIIENGQRKPSGLSFFYFPKNKAEKSMWCDLIKCKDGIWF